MSTQGNGNRQTDKDRLKWLQDHPGEKIAPGGFGNGEIPFGMMTEEQAAKLLNVSPSTLFRARRASKLKFYRVGWTIYYDAAQLESYVKNHCVSVRYRRAAPVSAAA